MIDYFTNFVFFIQDIYNSIISKFINYNYEHKKNPSLSKKTIIDYNKQRNKGPKKTICYAPFKHMYFKADGKVTPCCRNDKDIYGTIEAGSLKELWNSKSIESVRTKIENYNLCGGCNYCNTQLNSSNFNAFEGRLYDSILSKKAQEFPTEMTFEISNLCNLECIMCDGNYSSSIRKNREKLPEIENKYSSHVLEIIKEGIPHLQVARFLGGEPFLIPQYLEIIETIIQNNKGCKIYIQTNGTILNNRVKKIIEHKNINLSISIDSLQKETYEKIRKNGSFSRLMEHMEYFILRSKKFNQIININFCVMTNNWKEVTDMMRYCNENNFSISLIPVEFPRYLSLRSLNHSTLQAIVETYQKEEYSDLFSNNKFNSRKLIDLINYIKFILNESEQKSKRINHLSLQSDEKLEGILQHHFPKANLNSFDIQSINSILNSFVETLDPEITTIFYSTFILDLESHPNETPIYHFKNTNEWKVLFKEYLNNLLFCNEKIYYL